MSTENHTALSGLRVTHNVPVARVTLDDTALSMIAGALEQYAELVDGHDDATPDDYTTLAEIIRNSVEDGGIIDMPVMSDQGGGLARRTVELLDDLHARGVRTWEKA